MTPHRRTVLAFEHRYERLIHDGNEPDEALLILERQIAAEAIARIDKAQTINHADRTALHELIALLESQTGCRA